jgi:hypothetical protein
MKSSCDPPAARSAHGYKPFHSVQPFGKLPWRFLDELIAFYCDRGAPQILDATVNRLITQLRGIHGLIDNAQASLDGVLFNPPISFAQAAAYHKAVGYSWDGRSSWWSDMKDQAAEIIREAGKAICLSWDSTGFGASRGFVLERLLIVNHGGHWHDTIVTVERKTH